jgi:hypothetical protein
MPIRRRRALARSLPQSTQMRDVAMTKPSTTGSAADDDGEIRRSVLAYLQVHPRAADTLRGVVNWWLPQQRYENSRQRIEKVLAALVAEGLLHRDRLPDGEVLYALNEHRRPPPN